METKGILLWVGFLVICAIIYLISERMKKQIEENGIETDGVISRISDTGDTTATSLCCYVRFRTEDGEEIEAVLSNPGSDIEEGQQVRIKYHPKYRTNARLIR